MNIHAKGTRRKYSKRISIEKAQTKTVATTTIILATERTAGNEKHQIFLVSKGETKIRSAMAPFASTVITHKLKKDFLEIPNFTHTQMVIYQPHTNGTRKITNLSTQARHIHQSYYSLEKSQCGESETISTEPTVCDCIQTNTFKFCTAQSKMHGALQYFVYGRS